jgi:hypothetical protein
MSPLPSPSTRPRARMARPASIRICRTSPGRRAAALPFPPATPLPRPVARARLLVRGPARHLSPPSEAKRSVAGAAPTGMRGPPDDRDDRTCANAPACGSHRRVGYRPAGWIPAVGRRGRHCGTASRRRAHTCRERRTPPEG